MQQRDNTRNEKIKLSICIILELSVAVLIFMLSNQPATSSYSLTNKVADQIVEVSVTQQQWDARSLLVTRLRKSAHVILYTVFGMVTLEMVKSIAIVLQKSGKWLKYILYTFLFSILYAISDEVHQIFIPGRGASVCDVCIDTIGCMIGILIVLGMHLVLQCCLK